MEDPPEPSMQLLAEAAQNQSPLPDPQSKPADEQDDRSSSLSDLEDRPVTEGTNVPPDKSTQVSEEEDTEAETERLGESPDKIRKHKKVLLNANDVASTSTSTPSKKTEDAVAGANFSHSLNAESREDIRSDPIDQTSPISSLEESGEDASGVDSPTSSASRKRKRLDDDITDESLKQAAMQLLANQVGTEAAENIKGSAEFVITSANGRRTVANGEMFEENLEDSAPEQDEDQHEEETVEHEDAAESNDEDVDMEDAGAEAGASARNEEAARKKNALDMLGRIENDFALLRDRLFTERTKQLNEELSSLESDNITHPDYLAMVAAIENQRKERVALARTSFHYKVKALQNKSIAERTHHHSQYMQSAREIRDAALEQANEEWYQIQRGRRALDQEPVDRTPLTAMKRSDLIAHQSAYNTEVSILSGMAKYVGFPAAPEVTGASQSEVDEDLRKMGISLQPQPSHVSSSISQYLRQNLQAEKQFGKVTPWANAQHPQHSHSLNGPQPWSNGEPDNPFTPANQNNVPVSNLPNGSASTIAAPTPLSSEVATSNPRPMSRIVPEVYEETPSRQPMYDEQEDDRPMERQRTIGDHLHLHSSPLEKRPSHLAHSESAPRVLKSPDRRPSGTPVEGPIGAPGDSRFPTRFGSHGKMPAEVKVGMA